MAEPIDLSVEREARREVYDGVVCVCGEAWFELVGVINREGKVTGYKWPPRCRSCNKELERAR